MTGWVYFGLLYGSWAGVMMAAFGGLGAIPDGPFPGGWKGFLQGLPAGAIISLPCAVAHYCIHTLN